jgi:hypothetical protein
VIEHIEGPVSVQQVGATDMPQPPVMTRMTISAEAK